ncbi:MAG: hypothetical protein ABI972_22370 [Acidobacteriota bacterium]
MSEILQQPPAFLVFLGLAALGFTVLVISLVVGELFDFMDHDADFDHGGGPSFLSSRVLSVLVTAFGAIGAMSVNAGLAIPAASGVGFAGGVACAALVYWFARFLYSQQATTMTTSADLMGRSARVIIGIPKAGVGQVRCQTGDEIVDKVARSRSGDAIAENTIVKIDQVLGEIVIVQPEKSASES